VHDVRLNPFRRLVENQHRRLEHERAADGELLLLPPGEIAATPLAHRLEHRKQVEDPRRNSACAIGATLSDGALAKADADAHLQVFLNGELRKNFAALRHVAYAEARPCFGTLRAKVAALKCDFARRSGQQSHDALEQRGLAHAVAAHQAGARSSGHVEADVP